jgi:hypothetical protein
MILARRDSLIATLIAFAVLAAWILAWPASGEGDAVLHYLDSRLAVAGDPTRLLTAWARPLFKLLIFVPSQFSMTATRLTVAALAAVAVGQTIGLARDLKLPRPWLAGCFLLAQPFAFAMATDVMTELPAALAFVIAVRLWLNDRRALSCIVVSFTPLIRPEGFFLIVAWAVLVQFDFRSGWFRNCLLLSVGMLTWWLTTLAVSGDPMFIIKYWSWPAASYESYGRGTWWWYIARWPWYCGWAVLPVFVVGVGVTIRRKFALVWMVWLLVIGVHTILWWRGWFAAAGLDRITAVSSPMTAVIVLAGFNRIAEWLKPVSPVVLRAATAIYLTWAGWIVYQRYNFDPQHHHYAPVWQAAEYINSHNLLRPETIFFTADKLVLVPLDYPKRPVTYTPNFWSHELQREMLRSLPSGSVGVWDDVGAPAWFGISIEQFPDEGFELLQEFQVHSQELMARHMMRLEGPRPRISRYTVLRKR